MKQKQLFSVLLLAMVALLYSCNKDDDSNPSEPRPQPGEYILPLIETTDIHGHIINTEDESVHYNLAYIADKVKDIRGHGEDYKRDRLLLLDGGDLYQGTTISNLQQGKPIYAAIDMMDYDAVALGNHEFDWGIEYMIDPDATLPDYEYNNQHFINEVQVVCANLYQNGSRVDFTKDFVIVEKNAISPQGGTVKVKIGVIGFAENYASSIMTSQFTNKGFSIQNNASIANDIAFELESSGQADATILLIHGAADKAAQSLGENSVIDLVLGGHTHVNISGQTSWGLPYLQSACNCQAYAYAELKFNVDESGCVSFSNVYEQQTFDVDNNRNLHTYEGQNAEDLDGEILSFSDNAMVAVADRLKEVIGYINIDATNSRSDSNLSIPGSGGRASVMGNWMCDIYLRITEADVAFINSGSIRTTFTLDGQPTKNITFANVFEMFPFNNFIYVYEITYAELLQLFEYSMTSGGKGLFSRVAGIDCYYTSEEQTSSSGSTYYLEAVHSLVKDGTTIYENGTWTADWASRKLIVAASDFLATSDRIDKYTQMHNPMVAWNETPRLIINNIPETENAVRVLKAEAAASGGLLSIDIKPHFILYN